MSIHVAVFGYTVYTKAGLEALNKMGWHITLLCHTKNKGKCLALNTTTQVNDTFYYDDIQSDELATYVKSLNIDYIFVFGLTEKIPDTLISVPKIAAINTHPSYLPEIKGPNPWFWAIFHSYNETGLTLHYLNADWDCGDLIFQKKLSIHPNDTRGTLSERLNQLLKEIILENQDLLENGQLPRYKQIGEGTYFSIPKDAHVCLNFKRTAKELSANIRACNPNIPCMLNIKGLVVNIREAHVTDIQSDQPYNLIVTDDKRLLIAASDFFLDIKILERQKEGVFSSARFIELSSLQSGDTCQSIL